MIKNTLTDRLIEGESFNELLTAATSCSDATGRCCGVFGLSRAGRMFYYAALAQETQRPLIIVVPTDSDCNVLTGDLNRLTGGRACALLGRDLVLAHVEGQNHSHEYRRIEALGKMVGGRADIIVTTAEATCRPLPTKEQFCNATITLTVGLNFKLIDLTERLVMAGYVRRDNVEAPGQFSLRGGILDIFTPDLERPVRCEFWGDTIEQMAAFDVVSQRRDDRLKKVHISPAREVIFDSPEQVLKAFTDFVANRKDKKEITESFYEELVRLESGVMPASLDRFYPIKYKEYGALVDYLANPIIISDDYASTLEAAEATCKRGKLQIEALAIPEKLNYYGRANDYIKLLSKGSLIFESFERSIKGIKIDKHINILCHRIPVWSGVAKGLFEELADYIKRGYQCRLLVGTRRAAVAIEKELNLQGINATTEKNADSRRDVVVVEQGNLSAGADFVHEKLVVITGRRSDVVEKKARKTKGLSSLSDISPGDYVVHQNHGIGLYKGIKSREMQGVTKDYIMLEYSRGDALYIPVTQLDLLSRHSGAEDSVKLSKLGGVDWNKTKSKVKTATAEMAKELIELYAKRLETPGFAFDRDNDWQADFEQRFAYDETDDQLRAITEIKKDMQSGHAMDRLLCGDVGVGKTEVALRAAFKCILSGKQVALLCPTTILAMQHYNSIAERMEHFPVRPGILSRFKSTRDNNLTLRDMASGRIDIVVGTHKLIQKSVKFKNLGLLIVDEEQRFGVGHKERLKEMFVGVDVLTLSATPIPRTLNMALSGIRDLSTIDQPPYERQPVETYVTEYDDMVISSAIERELSRGGQVYYIHNRIDTIEFCASRVAKLCPGANIDFVHGRMDEKTLSSVWNRLLSGELDILICTTIIETGVDVRNCNTLIIEDADRLGLSQLYQMRGRVGRSSRKAYAYFTFKRDKVVSEIAEKRLSAIREFTSFGSGFRIAMRDLQIRGAGNLLGKSQSGHLSSVGYEMYMKMLNLAIAIEKGYKPAPDKSQCLIDISADAFIPEKYIPDTASRIEVYKRIAAIETTEDADDILSELADRYGAIPESARGLCEISLMRVTAAKLSFYEIGEKKGELICYTDAYEKQMLAPFISAMQGRAKYIDGTKPYILLRPGKGDNSVSLIKLALAQLEKLVYNSVTS